MPKPPNETDAEREARLVAKFTRRAGRIDEEIATLMVRLVTFDRVTQGAAILFPFAWDEYIAAHDSVKEHIAVARGWLETQVGLYHLGEEAAADAREHLERLQRSSDQLGGMIYLLGRATVHGDTTFTAAPVEEHTPLRGQRDALVWAGAPDTPPPVDRPAPQSAAPPPPLRISQLVGWMMRTYIHRRAVATSIAYRPEQRMDARGQMYLILTLLDYIQIHAPQETSVAPAWITQQVAWLSDLTTPLEDDQEMKG